MKYSRGTKKLGSMKEEQYQQILTAMMSVMNPVKP